MDLGAFRDCKATPAVTQESCVGATQDAVGALPAQEFKMRLEPPMWQHSRRTPETDSF